MNKIVSFLVALIFLLNARTSAQVLIMPGNKTIDPSLIKPGKFSMDYYAVSTTAGSTKMGIFETEVSVINQTLHFKNSFKESALNTDWLDDITVDATSFKTISRTSVRGNRNISLNYAASITGTDHDKKTGKKVSINQQPVGGYFDIAVYPFLIRTLPLKLGYKAIIPVYDYNAKDNKKSHSVFILDVKSYMYTAGITGNHDVWQVMVAEESTGNLFNYFIDKNTRKLWRVDMIDKENNSNFTYRDRETDYNPFKTVFNKAETFKLVSSGSAAIIGEAFARDNRATKDGSLLDINVVNFNKKQFAPQGTNVVLIPYTDYYKEWFELNKKQAKIKGAGAIPLPKEALECIKYTQIYDDKGHFEFANLMPGDYLLFVAFGYEDFFTRRETTGSADVYINGQYSGTEVYSDLFGYTTTGNATIQKVVTVKTTGETVKVKLKKT